MNLTLWSFFVLSYYYVIQPVQLIYPGREKGNVILRYSHHSFFITLFSFPDSILYFFRSFFCSPTIDWNSNSLSTTTTVTIRRSLIKLHPFISRCKQGGEEESSNCSFLYHFDSFSRYRHTLLFVYFFLPSVRLSHFIRWNHCDFWQSVPFFLSAYLSLVLSQPSTDPTSIIIQKDGERHHYVHLHSEKIVG